MKRTSMRILSLILVLGLIMSGFGTVPCKASSVTEVLDMLSGTEIDGEDEGSTGEAGDERTVTDIVFNIGTGESPEYVTAAEFPDVEIPAGQSYQLFSYVEYSDCTYSETGIIYESDDETVATVDVTGLITAKNVLCDEEVTITVSYMDYEVTLTFIINAVQIDKVQLEKDNKTLKLKESYTIVANVLPAEAPQTVEYVSSDDTVATVSEAGVITAVKEGTAIISVFPTGREDIEPATITVTVIDIPVLLELNKTSKSLMATKTFQLTASLTYISGKKIDITGEEIQKLKFLSTDNSVATVSATGLVTALEQKNYPKSAGITVTYNDTYLYDGETVSLEVTSACIFTITEIPVTSIALTNAETAVTVEIADTYTLVPVVAPANASNKTVKFKSSESSVASVNKEGVITAKDIGTAVITAYAEEDFDIKATFTITVYQTYFNVVKIGADGTDTDSDATPIRKALKAASKVNEPIHVYIPSGTYYLHTSLIMYSNTTLELAPDAVIIRKSSAGDSPMLRSNIDSSVGGYGQIQNVTITGGVWDGNADGKKNFNNLYFGHGQNITIKNTTIKNNSGAHLIELTGINNVLIDNVTLTGYKLCTKKGYYTSQTVKEAIQLDYCSKASASSMKPYDNTPTQNVTIQNCNISNYMCGVGAHGSKSGVYLDNIKIHNNTFTNITNACIDARNFTNLDIRNNTVSGYTTFLYANNSKGKVVSNTIKNKSYKKIKSTGLLSANGITVSGGSVFTISKNKIYSAKSNGICVWGKSRASVKSNTIKSSGLYGVRTNTSSVTLSKNKLSKNKEGYYDTNKTSTVKSSDDIRAYYIDIDETYKYTGKWIRPEIKIKGLKKNKHFKVSYKNNKKVGTATITIKGKGKYKGTLKITFEIVKKKKK